MSKRREHRVQLPVEPASGGPVRCAIYTRKSTEHGLDQAFNSLDAQRQSGEAYISSQAGKGWVCLPQRYDDGGFSGGDTDRPALKQLLADIDAGRIDCVVVYKVDRLSRSLLDFARLMEHFDREGVTFSSVTQQFSTADSMGRLTLNMLLSFAQFEREVISDRTRDKIAATRRRGMFAGGRPVLGYDLDRCRLTVNAPEAERVRAIFNLYLRSASLTAAVDELETLGWRNKAWTTRAGKPQGGHPFTKGRLHGLLTNVVYLGKVRHHDEVHAGVHEAIVDQDLFDRVARKLDDGSIEGGSRVMNKHGALLKGMVRCRGCGCRLTHTFTTKHGGVKYRYYACHTVKARGSAACATRAVPAEQLEAVVVERVRRVASDPVTVTHVLDEVRTLTHQRLAELDRQMEAASANQRKALTAEAKVLRARLVTRTDFESDGGLFDRVWASLEPREREEIVRLVVRQVTYDARAGEVTIAFRDGMEPLGENGDLNAREAVA